MFFTNIFQNNEIILKKIKNELNLKNNFIPEFKFIKKKMKEK